LFLSSINKRKQYEVHAPEPVQSNQNINTCHIFQGFLRGAPGLSKKAIAKYLPPSPATLKDHMQWPRKGLRSTTPKILRIKVLAIIPDPIMPGLVPPIETDNISNTEPRFHFIDNVDDHLIANVFCFGALPTKQQELLTTTAPENFPSCCLMAMSVSL
jgi:hypothetical protein